MYLKIVSDLEYQIFTGNISSHQLPSIRKLADKLKVSVITIKKAYAILENDHIIISQPKKGYTISSKARDIIIEKRKEEVKSALVYIEKTLEVYDISLSDFFN
ncbi:MULTISPECIES: GntR family transcriptional regulator [Staphylococcus]|uniref:GntR family transcriptional regulator n=1 Tax=Staphylococcus TaxID=1279 RepID=UPI0016434BFF|nr:MULTISPECIES: GntR family transcriptional regulator [Staphylococcus]MBC3135069.1 GntR family transcriptional regulator [Staphylococcus warneri]MBC8781536.1 GntR family transcriptional regulator [Staphylococcus capitis]MCM3509081.1 GntR family transcriptional regulator [Staphylococcus capitis]MDH9600886.1 GntR family transcriptional regulator [Staphylococcus capitis]MDH9624639.1 GntR family transcriptional regulator [Staphylococcus capitis]